MEVANSGVIMRPNPCLSRGDDAHFHRHRFYYHDKNTSTCMMMGMGCSYSSSSSALVRRKRRGGGGGYTRKHFNLGYYDKDQLDYYDNNKSSSLIRCGGGGGGCAGKKDKVKDKGKEEKKMMKKRLKLLKALSKDLSVFSQMMGSDGNAFHADQVKPNNISEAAELLLVQLQKLRAEEKELKRKRKQEKIQLREIEPDMSCSSSCSSESSDSECDEQKEVVNVKSLKCESFAQPILVDKETNVVSGSILKQETVVSLLHYPPLLTSESIHHPQTTLDHHQDKWNKIEVCMGGKCKKSGAASLIQEFQKVVGGVDVAVCGCKCMGKCKDGPNVRVVKSSNNIIVDDVRTPSNPLYLGVGLEDVGLIVANFFGGDDIEIGLPTAAAPQQLTQ